MILTQDPVQAAILNALNHHCYTDASFLAERLYAEVPTECSMLMLANSYIQQGKLRVAYLFLKNQTLQSAKCKYLYARCCFEQQLYGEAERSLLDQVVKERSIGSAESITTFTSFYQNSAPYALDLLGQIYRRNCRDKQSEEMFKEALRLNPLIWSSFTALCEMGCKIVPEELFSSSQVSQLMRSVRSVMLNQAQSAGQSADGSGSLSHSMDQSRPITPSLQIDRSMGTDQISGILNIDSMVSSDYCTPLGSTLSTAGTALSNTGPAPYTQPAPSTNPAQTPGPPLPQSAASTASPLIVGSITTPATTSEWAAVTTDKLPGGSVLRRGDLEGSYLDVEQPLSSKFSRFDINRQAPQPHVSPISAPRFGLEPLDIPLYCDVTPNCMTTPAMDIVHAPQLKRKTAHPSTPTPSIASPSRLVFGQSSTSNLTSTRDAVQSVGIQRRSKRIRDSQNSISVKENSKSVSRSRLVSSSRGSTRKSHAARLEDLNVKNRSMSGLIAGKTGDARGREVMGDPEAAVDWLEQRQRQAAENFLDLLCSLACAYLSLQRYECQAALDRFNSLPSNQYKTSWVLSLAGKAYLELQQYHSARNVFKTQRQLECYQTRGMETYSTVLYHLQEERELSQLAHELLELNRDVSETWCVNGNCLSLQKEHEGAIRFMKRAIQVQPDFTYAYTLLGHELTAVEDYEKATQAFRSAIRYDPHHYQAWYGLGLIHYKKEKYTSAEIHFQKAIDINPRNAVLVCHLGLVQHALQKHDAALTTLNEAVRLAPRNPLCLFHRASMLVNNFRYEEALEELNTLKSLTPNESLVYDLLGKVHKKLGNSHLSMLNWSWAQHLDPKGSNNHIKEAIYKRYNVDDDPSAQETDESVLQADEPLSRQSTPSSLVSLSGEGEMDDIPLQAQESDSSLT